MHELPIIQVKNFSAYYGSKEILKDISFDVERGEILMIVGGSGCGKTTLLNHMIGLLRVEVGEIVIDGITVDWKNEKDLLAIWRKIGVLYQGGALFGSMNLLQNITLPLEELTDLPTEAIEVIAYNKLKMVGLNDFCNYMPAEISGGMQKRVALARAMVLDPKVLFLDEPSAGLDPIKSAELDALIMSLSNTLGITFVIITHALHSIFKIANRVIFLDKGNIIAQGKPSELKNHSNLLVKNFFNQEVAM